MEAVYNKRETLPNIRNLMLATTYKKKASLKIIKENIIDEPVLDDSESLKGEYLITIRYIEIAKRVVESCMYDDNYALSSLLSLISGYEEFINEQWQSFKGNQLRNYRSSILKSIEEYIKMYGGKYPDLNISNSLKTLLMSENNDSIMIGKR